MKQFFILTIPTRVSIHLFFCLLEREARRGDSDIYQDSLSIEMDFSGIIHRSRSPAAWDGKEILRQILKFFDKGGEPITRGESELETVLRDPALSDALNREKEMHAETF